MKDDTQLKNEISRLERRFENKKRTLTKLLAATNSDNQQELVKKQLKKEIKTAKKQIKEKVKYFQQGCIYA